MSVAQIFAKTQRSILVLEKNRFFVLFFTKKNLEKNTNFYCYYYQAKQGSKYLFMMCRGSGCWGRRGGPNILLFCILTGFSQKKYFFKARRCLQGQTKREGIYFLRFQNFHLF